MARRGSVGLIGLVLASAAAVLFAASPVAGSSSSTSTGSPAAGLVHVAGPAGRPDLLVIGASYSAGVGASGFDSGYAVQLARQLQMSADIDAVPGSGFLNPGPARAGAFAPRLAALPPGLHPALVLFQGGRNDSGFPPARLSRGVRDTLTAAHARFGSARLAVLGPVPGSWPVNPAQQRVDAVLRSATQAAGAIYLDPIAEHWMSAADLARFSGRVSGHPNDQGYTYLAGRTRAELGGGIAGAPGPG